MESSLYTGRGRHGGSYADRRSVFGPIGNMSKHRLCFSPVPLSPWVYRTSHPFSVPGRTWADEAPDTVSSRTTDCVAPDSPLGIGQALPPWPRAMRPIRHRLDTRVGQHVAGLRAIRKAALRTPRHLSSILAPGSCILPTNAIDPPGICVHARTSWMTATDFSADVSASAQTRSRGVWSFEKVDRRRNGIWKHIVPYHFSEAIVVLLRAAHGSEPASREEFDAELGDPMTWTEFVFIRCVLFRSYLPFRVWANGRGSDIHCVQALSSRSIASPEITDRSG
ncbi:hypothetical protein DFH07DRAFT_244725 [Mycena maculata]|uniref:Uncharacterized protein n=1 Tax=Mycena maculata TaxID=230809 RepID=A0AAD7MPG0_9AGAR|nr:hypothetical protein DFH07DRAFT_244725 [Mycena maculata]